MTRRRIIRLDTLTTHRDVYGSPVEGYVELASVWATVTPNGGRESFVKGAARRVPLRFATFRFRWREGVQETGRVVYDDGGATGPLAWDIKGVREIGRKRELELICTTDASRAP